jgi:hypothetical protein
MVALALLLILNGWSLRAAKSRCAPLIRVRGGGDFDAASVEQVCECVQ